ncbi:MAG: hypothetical protein IJW21_08260 [Clostridia bacterium]|nr:hypothetical protein [Clostridia bacterium]
MKFKGLKAIYSLIIISVIFILIDAFLIFYLNSDLILLYTLIAVIPICCILSVFGEIGIPAISFDNNSRTICTYHIKDERRAARSADSTAKKELFFSTIYYDEIVSVAVNNKILTVTLQSGYPKTLYLTSFTQKQIYRIVDNITKLL